MTELVFRCETCSSPLLEGDRFCEACGTSVAAADAPEGAACGTCGAAAAAIDADGYCGVCGVLEHSDGQRAALDLLVAAAVTERGRTHRRNEDAVHLQRVDDHGVAAVVCDGISTALSGHLAAQTAASAAGVVLAEALRTRGGGAVLAEATRAGVLAAREAVRGVPWTARSELALPSCTIVSAAWSGEDVVIGWVGDSRAYWLGSGDARQLTVDDSWATEQIAEGRLTSEEAAGDRRAHALTRWVGADAPDDVPHVTAFRPASPGRLVLCSDGLWNYAPAATELAELLGGLDRTASPAAVAGRLTDAAMARGGRDDVTVAVIAIDPAPRSRR